ncbi:MAG: hypothetical protein ABID40_04885 [Candidatus Bipolaricaulota bacterium]
MDKINKAVIGALFVIILAVLGFAVRDWHDRMLDTERTQRDLSIRISALEANSVAMGRSLERIEAKLDRLIERKNPEHEK